MEKNDLVRTNDENKREFEFEFENKSIRKQAKM